MATKQTSNTSSATEEVKMVNGNSLTRREQKLLRELSRESASLGDLEDRLDRDSHGIYETGTRLQEKGYNIVISEEGGSTFLSLVKDEALLPEAITIKDVSRKFRVAIVSELRLGARQSQLSLTHWLWKMFERERVDFVVFAGGLIVGRTTQTLRPDMHKITPQAQTDYAIRYFPSSTQFKTYYIGGRRELSHKTSKGFDAVSAIASARDDIVAAGDLERTFDIRGVRIKVMSTHDDNSPIGLSYGVQKIAQNISEDPFPEIIVMAGLHIRSEIPAYVNGSTVFTVPSLHTQMRRQRSQHRGISPDVGALIIELNFDKNWKLKESGGIRAHHISLNKYVQHDDYLTHVSDNASGKKLSANERKVLEWLDNENLSHGALRRRLGRSRSTLDRILTKLRKLGFEITTSKETNLVILKRPEKDSFAPPPFVYEDVFQMRVKEAHVSDTHYGSIHDMPEIVQYAYQEAARSGVQIMYHSGDLTEGPGGSGYRNHQNDVRMVKIDDMTDYAAEQWPRVKITVDGKEAWLFTKAIDGNHDAWADVIGHSPVRAVSLRIPELLEYIGSQSAITIDNGVFHKLVHPAGGLGYTLSTKLQKHMAALAQRREGEGLPRVHALGNWHVAYLLFRDTLGLLIPCFKDEDDFHATRALVPAIGMWIIELYTDNDNNITRVISEYRSFQKLVNEMNERKNS